MEPAGGPNVLNHTDQLKVTMLGRQVHRRLPVESHLAGVRTTLQQVPCRIEAVVQRGPLQGKEPGCEGWMEWQLEGPRTEGREIARELKNERIR